MTQAIRDMVDGDKSSPASVGHPAYANGGGDKDHHERHARAAQVLAAVVSGLTSTPRELGSKHRANRSGGASGTGAKESGAGASLAAAKPAVQKIRDYQLQVTLQHKCPTVWLLHLICVCGQLSLRTRVR